jgi:hypothetical protein
LRTLAGVTPRGAMMPASLGSRRAFAAFW